MFSRKRLNFMLVASRVVKQKRRAVLLLSYFFLMLLPQLEWALFQEGIQEKSSFFISLEGELDQFKINEASDGLDAAYGNKGKELVIEVNSFTGNLSEVFHLAQKIDFLKKKEGVKVTVFINGNATGPSAIIPFLADDLLTSPSFAWGNPFLGSAKALSLEYLGKIFPISLLVSQVKNFIKPGGASSKPLEAIVEGMLNPKLTTLESPDKKARSGFLQDVALPQGKGEFLVVNEQTLKRLGISAREVTSESFDLEYLNLPFLNQKLESPPGDNQKAKRAKLTLKKLQEKILFNDKEINRVGKITIGGKDTAIEHATWIYVKSALDYYKKKKPAFIILELNTPGGEVFSAEQIAQALKAIDSEDHIPVVALIDNWALSAGALLAYSCRFIAATQDASMGAAEPILMGENGAMESAPEKINSALRASFANAASYYGRDPLLAKAMVDKDMLLVQRQGRFIELEGEAELRKEGLNPDKIISRKGKLLTLSAKELIDYGLADIDLSANPNLESGVALSSSVSHGKLFRNSFFASIPHLEMDIYQMSWQLKFLAFLAKPGVASLLFLGLIFGFYLEMKTPGFGVGGSIGLLCLGLIVTSHFTFQIANMLGLIILLLGVLLLALEIFVIPGFGLTGILGGVFTLLGLFGIMLPSIGKVGFDWDSHSFNAAGEFFVTQLAWLSGTLVLGIIMILLFWRFFGAKCNFLKRFVLTGNEAAQEFGARGEELPLVGDQGKAATMLRPAGKIEIGKNIYDAMSQGDFIEQDEKIRVIRIEGKKVVVERNS